MASLRGTKGTIWEGGTRLPLITRWPGHIQPGVSDALVCQVDMLASFAALTGQKLADADGPDSYNVLPALLGQKTGTPCRDYLVEQNNQRLRAGPAPWPVEVHSGPRRRESRAPQEGQARKPLRGRGGPRSSPGHRRTLQSGR